MKRGPKVRTLAERFWRWVKKTPGCWLWTGHLNTHGGHGQITIKGKEQWPAHRAAYLLYHGSIPKGKKILHTCDVNICVRREHLYPGTNADNTRDMMVRGRARWDGAGKKKLTPAQRRQLVSLIQKGGTVRGLARQFGVSPATVQYWRSVGNLSGIRL
jgi:hypothetical protein